MREEDDDYENDADKGRDQQDRREEGMVRLQRGKLNLPLAWSSGSTHLASVLVAGIG
jgi:hypothetical protein